MHAKSLISLGSGVGILLTILALPPNGCPVAEAQPEGPIPKGIIFSRGPGGPLNYHRYRTFSADGGKTGSLEYRYDTFSVGVEYAFRDAYLIGLQGGIYKVQRSQTRTMLWLVAEKDLPKRFKVPARDSFTVPFERVDPTSWANIQHDEPEFSQVKVREFRLSKDQKTEHWTATVSVAHAKTLSFATIRAGDVLLIGAFGHLVRAIVPVDEPPGSAGWVEFAPQFTSEAELIRTKKAFVRPIPKKEEKK